MCEFTIDKIFDNNTDLENTEFILTDDSQQAPPMGIMEATASIIEATTKRFFKSLELVAMNYLDPLSFLLPTQNLLSLIRIIGNFPLYKKFPAFFENPEYNNIYTSKSLLLFLVGKFYPHSTCDKEK